MSIEFGKIIENHLDSKEKVVNFDPDKRIDFSSKESVNKGLGYNPDKRLDNNRDGIKEGKYYSSLKEIIDQTPSYNNPNAYWSDVKGNSHCYPDLDSSKGYDAYLKMNEYGMDYVDYQDGIPDFSTCTEETVPIDMTSDRPSNMVKADEECAKQWNKEMKDGRNDWKARDVKDYRKEKGLTWHECIDGMTCQLIPTIIHEVFTHLGGVSECKKKEAMEQ